MRKTPAARIALGGMLAALAIVIMNLVGMIPWCIACSVPLANMGGTPAAIPFAVFLYLVPLCAWVGSRKKTVESGCNPEE
jgi:NhaC family Na+:H+ antiporter